MPKVSQAYLDKRRGEILEAAIGCFAREGFHRTTMAEIVKESELSPGAIYNYFDGKEEIIEAIAEDRREVEEKLIAEAAKAPDVVMALRRMRDAFFGDLKTPKERLRRRLSIQLWAEAQRNPRILRLVRGSFEAPLKLLKGILTEAQQRGEISRKVDVDATARFLIAAFHGLVLQVEWDNDNSLKVQAQIRLLDIFLESILAVRDPVVD
jgi:TetR/AcrR family transcriptional regulator, transcriptional repressor of aconitase